MKFSPHYLLAFFLLIAMNGFTQSTDDKKSKSEVEREAESRINQLLAQTQRMKTEVEQLGRFVKENIDTHSPQYQTAFQNYVHVQAQFDGWIEFYLLELNSALKNKKYKINGPMLDSLITASVASANAFTQSVHSDTTLASRGLGLAIVFDAADYIKKAYALFTEFRDAKEERQKALMAELREKFNAYKLKSFFDL